MAKEIRGWWWWSPKTSFSRATPGLTDPCHPPQSRNLAPRSETDPRLLAPRAFQRAKNGFRTTGFHTVGRSFQDGPFRRETKAHSDQRGLFRVEGSRNNGAISWVLSSGVKRVRDNMVLSWGTPNLFCFWRRPSCPNFRRLHGALLV